MSISARECKYLTDLLENEIKERQALIEKLRSDCPELATPDAPSRLIDKQPPERPQADPPRPERRRGRQKAQATKPKREQKTKRSSKTTYYGSLGHISTILEKEGEPLTPFKIKELLAERFNIQVTEEILTKALKLGVTREIFCSPQQGEYAIAN